MRTIPAPAPRGSSWRLCARTAVAAAIAAATLITACTPQRPSSEWLTVQDVTPAFLAERGAIHPALAADASGRVALTFVTKDSTGLSVWLAVSSDSGLSFGPPQRVNEGVPRVVSFLESRPIAAFGPGGRLAIAWSQHRPGDDGAADLMVRSSGDGGATLGPIMRVNDDSTGRPCFHGFATIAFREDGSLFAAWMDERDNPPIEGEASSAALYSSLSHDGGQRWSANQRVTDRLCPCCRSTAVATSGNGIAIAYRAAGDSVRDPALAVSSDGGVSFAIDTLFSADRWRIDGCPVVGPVLTAQREGGGDYAWFSGAGTPAVYVAPWRAAHGISAPRRAVMDSLRSASHPRLVALGPSSLLGAEAQTHEDSVHTRFAVRALDPDGRLTPWVFLGADTDGGWLAEQGPRTALACWSERAEAGPGVRIARLTRTR